jgi:hypothetical protein
VTAVELPPDAPGPWDVVSELADLLPGGWVLIGGLMVQLHALERGVRDVRATMDVDVLGQARPQGALRAIDAALTGAGFQSAPPDADGFAHRYERAGVIIDVVAPEGIRPPATLDGSRKAVGVPGGTQALWRSETVTVTVGRRSFALRRPTLLGAVLIKARSLLVHHDPDAQREDLLRLLSLVEDPRRMAGEMTSSERRWLRDAEPRLRLNESSSLSAGDVRRARQALRLLLRSA